MQSTKVMCRDKVTATLGGNLLTVEGAVHQLRLKLGKRGLESGEASDVAKSLVEEIKRRYHDVQRLRNSSCVLEVSAQLEETQLDDAGAAAIVSAFHRVSDVARASSIKFDAIGQATVEALTRLIREAPHGVDAIEATSSEGVDARAATALRNAAERSGTKLRVVFSRGCRGATLEHLWQEKDGYDHVLSFREVGLGDADLPSLGRRLAEEVKRRRQRMDLPTVGTLVELKLDLSRNQLTDPGFLLMALCDIRDIAYVSTLKLRGNGITCRGARNVAEFIKRTLRPVDHVDLAHNSIADDGCAALFRAASERGQPLSLLLEGNMIRCPPTEGSSFVRAPRLAGFQRAADSHRRTAGTLSVGDSLLTQISPCEYRVLMDGCDLDDDDAVDVAVALHTELDDVAEKVVLDVCLDDNHIGDRGVVALAGVLVRKQVDVRLISLNRNHVGDDGLRALCDLVETGVVSTLCLARNRLVDCRCLVDAVRTRDRQLVVHLAGNPLGGPNTALRDSCDMLQVVDMPLKETRPIEDDLRVKKKKQVLHTPTKNPTTIIREPLKAVVESASNKDTSALESDPETTTTKAKKKKKKTNKGKKTPETVFESDEVPEAMEKAGFPNKYARWTKAAMTRCRGKVENERWRLCEVPEFLIRADATLEPSDQRRLQDRLILAGCVAVVTGSPRDATGAYRVAVVALSCTATVQDIPERIASALWSKLELVQDTPKKSDPAASSSVTVPKESPPDDPEPSPRREEDDNDDALLFPQGDEVPPEESFDSAAAALSKKEAADVAAARSTLKAERSRVGDELLDDLSKSTPETWDYVSDAMDQDVDFLGATLDAMVPSFSLIDDEARDECLEAVLRCCRAQSSDSEESATLEATLALVRTAVVVTGPEEEAPSNGDSSVDRWRRLVLGLRRAVPARDAAVFAAVLLFWRARAEQRSHLAVQALKKAAPDFQEGELAQAWKERDCDVRLTADWLRKTSNRSQARGDLRRKALDADVDRRRRRASITDRRDQTRDMVVERFAHRPPTAGWRSSIHAKTFVYGTDNAKVRYLDGKVVTTTGQKEIVLRDGPDFGQGHRRLTKGSTGTLRCAAAGSKGAVG